MIPTEVTLTDEEFFPPWYDEKIDYTDPRFHEAIAFGRAAANAATCEWDVAEPSLMEVWSLSPRQGKWSDIRGAVFYAWHETRLALPFEQEWADDEAFYRSH
ncbi:hypothetical protein LVB87_11370 [Lysobacter sp. KIS68-7]|uniref:hypothetical protein n=1 Tax=Lysobacter sp. KIS68-7 TaxID=2904252 RepID=UPI001E5EB9A7|nr:hypothetical protein [Lysobacter sp. KIS68-7]UHQ18781.1 hypothetical protein LVB87_11370 [Lysobacter sp. KIS68-7]